MPNRLSSSAIALTAALASPAYADVTAADVWENQQALFASMGIDLAGTLSGDQLSAPGLDINVLQGVANLNVMTDATVALADNGDGTVTITYPSPMSIFVTGGAKDEGSFAADVTVTHDGYSVIASGVPGDVSYVSQGQNLRLDIGTFTMKTPSEGEENVDVDGYVALDDWSGTSQVTVGAMIDYIADAAYGASTADFTSTSDNIIAQTEQQTLPMTTAIRASLPAGGSDLMNLSAATRNGLNVTLQSDADGSVSSSKTTLNGDVLNSQSTSTGSQSMTIDFGEDGLSLSGDANTFALVMNDPLVFPDDIEFALDSATLDLDIPLHASDDQQDFRLALGLTDISLGDNIWNMFDPAGQLPRDPAVLSFDITGTGTNGVDLLDILALRQIAGPPPIKVDDVTIESLTIGAVGADIMAAGSMMFDWTDFQTVPGMPRPEGQVTVNLNGANKLLDTLSQMGLIAQEDLMMPRMMLGMFSTPVGDDMLESVIEVNEQGHVLANGQRIR